MNALSAEAKKDFKHYLKRLSKVASKYTSLLVALGVAILSLFVFYAIYYPDFFQNHLHLRKRYFLAIIVGAQLLFTYIVCYQKPWGIFRSVLVWVQSNILTVFLLLYYSRLNNSSLDFEGWNLSSASSAIFLTTLVFFVNYNLFGEYKKNFNLIAGKVFFLALTVFSFISFILADRTGSREFDSEILSYVFNNIHPIAWLALTSAAISISSIFTIKVKGIKRLFSFVLLFWFLVFQLIFGVYLISLVDFAEVRNLGYWQLTLLFLIVWDLVYQPLVHVIEDVGDYKFKQRTLVSSVYHGLLFLIVLYYDPIVKVLEPVINFVKGLF